MQHTILVTGINGFVGRHLAEALHASGITVIGLGTDTSVNESLSEIVSEYYQCDLTDQVQVDSLPLEKVNGIVNLAGLAAVGPSFDNPELYMRVNTAVLSTLCKSAMDKNKVIRIVSISSGAVYASNQPQPLTELSMTDASSSPYAASKLAMEQIAHDFATQGLTCIVARPMNHCGPYQGPGFIVPDLAQQLVAYEKGSSDKILVGNLDAKRDYTDVRDIVRAYMLLLDKGNSGEVYNICSGKPRSGHDILAALQQASGIEPPVEQDLSKMRASDSPVIFGDHSKLSDHVGWQPTIAFEDTMRDVVADWRSKI